MKKRAPRLHPRTPESLMANFRSPDSLPPASLPRRLGAIIYDSLLLAAVLLAGSVLAVTVCTGIIGTEQFKQHNPLIGNPFFSTYLFFICFFFYAWFWTHGGQTLGMRAWKIRLQQQDGKGITWWQALLRFLLGTLWVLPILYLRKFQGESLDISLDAGAAVLALTLLSRLHDRVSATVLVYLKNPA
jgi:uncharacterized RDD family membrane protein YckC